MATMHDAGVTSAKPARESRSCATPVAMMARMAVRLLSAPKLAAASEASDSGELWWRDRHEIFTQESFTALSRIRRILMIRDIERALWRPSLLHGPPLLAQPRSSDRSPRAGLTRRRIPVARVPRAVAPRIAAAPPREGRSVPQGGGGSGNAGTTSAMAGGGSSSSSGNAGGGSGAGGGGGPANGGTGAAGGPSSTKFSFFMTSQAGLQRLSNSEDGFGGDLKFGKADGVSGADEICRQLAETSLPGNGKTWRSVPERDERPGWETRERHRSRGRRTLVRPSRPRRRDEQGCASQAASRRRRSCHQRRLAQRGWSTQS